MNAPLMRSYKWDRWKNPLRARPLLPTSPLELEDVEPEDEEADEDDDDEEEEEEEEEDGDDLKYTSSCRMLVIIPTPSHTSKYREYATLMGRKVITYRKASTHIKNPKTMNFSTFDGTVRKFCIFPTAAGCK